MQAVLDKLCQEVRDFGIAVIPRRLTVSEGTPQVDWEDDRAGFMDALASLRPTAIYAWMAPFGKEYLEKFVSDYGLDEEPDQITAQAVHLVTEARTHIDEPAIVFASFVHGSVVHALLLWAPWYKDLHERISNCVEKMDEAIDRSPEWQVEFRRHETEWKDRLYNLLITDEAYITGRNQAIRGDRFSELITENFGRDQSHSGWVGVYARAERERDRIVADRKSAAEVMISEWADELSQLEPFRTGSTQAARRPVVKAFLQQREPLAVTTDMIARLEQAANRLRRG